MVLVLSSYMGLGKRLASFGGANGGLWAHVGWLLLSLSSLGRLASGEALGVRLEWTRLVLLVAAAVVPRSTATLAAHFAALPDVHPALALSLLGAWAWLGGPHWWITPDTVSRPPSVRAADTSEASTLKHGAQEKGKGYTKAAAEDEAVLRLPSSLVSLPRSQVRRPTRGEASPAAGPAA